MGTPGALLKHTFFAFFEGISHPSLAATLVPVSPTPDSMSREPLLQASGLQPRTRYTLFLANSPVLGALPVQLLAYHTAVAKGTDVDQPRNLAKSVTVE